MAQDLEVQGFPTQLWVCQMGWVRSNKNTELLKMENVILMNLFKRIGKEHMTWGIGQNTRLHAFAAHHTTLEKESVKVW